MRVLVGLNTFQAALDWWCEANENDKDKMMRTAIKEKSSIDTLNNTKESKATKPFLFGRPHQSHDGTTVL